MNKLTISLLLGLFSIPLTNAVQIWNKTDQDIVIIAKNRRGTPVIHETKVPANKQVDVGDLFQGGSENRDFPFVFHIWFAKDFKKTTHHEKSGVLKWEPTEQQLYDERTIHTLRASGQTRIVPNQLMIFYNPSQIHAENHGFSYVYTNSPHLDYMTTPVSATESEYATTTARGQRREREEYTSTPVSRGRRPEAEEYATTPVSRPTESEYATTPIRTPRREEEEYSRYQHPVSSEYATTPARGQRREREEYTSTPISRGRRPEAEEYATTPVSRPTESEYATTPATSSRPSSTSITSQPQRKTEYTTGEALGRATTPRSQEQTSREYSTWGEEKKSEYTTLPAPGKDWPQ